MNITIEKENIKFGWIPESPDPRDYSINHPKIAPFIVEKDSSNLPTSFSLRNKDSPIEDQGNFGSCTSFAAAGALQFYDKQAGDSTNLSETYIYFWNRYIDNGGDPTKPYDAQYAPTEDSGSTIRSTQKAIQKMGSCTEVSCPYPPSDINAKPSDSAITEAKGYSVINYSKIAEDSSKIANMKKAIYSGLPIMFGRNVPNEIFNVGIDGIEPLATDYAGGHAQMATGFDDEKVIPGASKPGAFEIRNSWNSTWADKGYEWVSYEAFKSQQTDCGFIVKANIPSTPTPTPVDPTDYKTLYEQLKEKYDSMVSSLKNLVASS